MDHVDLVGRRLPLPPAEVRHSGVGGHHHHLLLTFVKGDQNPPEEVIDNSNKQDFQVDGLGMDDS